MKIWILVTAVVLPVVIVLGLIILILRRCRSNKRHNDFIETRRIRSSESLQSGIAKLHVAYETNSQKKVGSVNYNHRDQDNKRKMNYYVLRSGLSTKMFFNWADHPSLVSEAVENGWSRFAFNGTCNMSSPSTRSVLLGLCVSSDQGKENEAEISWEVCSGSADFMQKIRLNPRLRKTSISTSSTPLGASCVIQTALPLPGPFLGNSSFPQEAYFEITILSSREGDDEKAKDKRSEGERTKLIQEVVNVNVQSDESKIVIKEDGRSEAVVLCVGLTVGGSLPRKLPGSYPGSIGFNSTGSVYLDGIKLVFETEKAEWGSIDRLIGCGFDPSQKKVFFTVDSELVHVIHCKSDEFSSPLYPTLAANIDVTVLVNFGQSAFKYAPANVNRTPNPCFIGSIANGHAAALGYEDSKELFSMGRIDSEWLNRSTTKNSHSTINIDNTKIDIDEESETDLFEIVLDNLNKSPSTFLQR